MKTAFTYWNKRIAPVFDTARLIRVIQTESGRIISEKLETVEGDQAVQKALRLSELGVNTLVCGAISSSFHEMVAAYGIQVIPFVAGNCQEVIQAWLNGNLELRRYTMPGCKKRKGGGQNERQGIQCQRI